MSCIKSSPIRRNAHEDRPLVSAVALACVLSGAAWPTTRSSKSASSTTSPASTPTPAGRARCSRRKWRSRTAGSPPRAGRSSVISGDHQNKPDVGAGIARKWFDEDKIDVIADVPNSGVALAVASVVKEKNGVFLNSGAATSDLTGKACTPNTVHWTYDTYMLAHGTGDGGGQGRRRHLVLPHRRLRLRQGAAARHHRGRRGQRRQGASAASMCRSTRPTSRRSCCRRRPRRPRSSASPTPAATPTNSIKQAHEFGIVAGGQKLAALLLFISDVNALGLDVAQGLQFTETFYWDLNDGTRAFSKRFSERMKNHAMPTEDPGRRLRLDPALSQGARGARRQSA